MKEQHRQRRTRPSLDDNTRTADSIPRKPVPAQGRQELWRTVQFEEIHNLIRTTRYNTIFCILSKNTNFKKSNGKKERKANNNFRTLAGAGTRVLRPILMQSDWEDRKAGTRVLRPILRQSDWEERKGRFPIHNLFDGCVWIPSLSPIGSSLFVLFLCSFWGRLIRGSRAGGSQFKTASSCPVLLAVSGGSVCNELVAVLKHVFVATFREQSVRLADGEPSSASSSRLGRWNSKESTAAAASCCSSGVAKRSSITRTHCCHRMTVRADGGRRKGCTTPSSEKQQQQQSRQHRSCCRV